jgi:hypothetical protein
MVAAFCNQKASYLFKGLFIKTPLTTNFFSLKRALLRPFIFTMKRIILAIAFLLSIVNISLGQRPRTCGTMEAYELQKINDPGIVQRRQQIEDQTNAFIAARAQMAGRTDAVITIPVVFHIVYSSSSQNISDLQCQAQARK